MYISKKSLNRRTFLKGTGVTVALPFLDAMVPAFASTPAIPLRFGVMYTPNGIIKDAWRVPEGKTADKELIYSTWSRQPRVFYGIDNGASESVSGHVGGSSMYLTGVTPNESLSEIRCGISLDQVIANETGKQTPIKSIQICIENAAELAGQSAGGYSSAYTNTISWEAETTPLPMEYRPGAIFDRMFGMVRTAEDRKADLLRKKSILDTISGQTKDTMRKMGASDKRKLDEYLVAIRGMEQQLEIAAGKNFDNINIPEKPIGIPAHEEHIKVMLDMMRVAFQTDMTRAFTFMVAREYSELVFTQLGHQDPYHPLTHHRGDKKRKQQATEIDLYHGRLFGEFIKSMEDTKEIDGSSLLDNSILLYGAGMGDADIHSQWNAPVFLVGSDIKPGLQYESEGTSMSNIHMGILQKFGIEKQSFGQSTGTIMV